MSKKEAWEDRRFEKLGELLESWRKAKFRSASELFREAKLPFSYSSYIEFERGVSLPSVAQLMELARVLGGDPAEGALVWAEVQMPNEALRSLFRRAGQAPLVSQSAPAEPPIENRWVFGRAEHDFLVKEPWFFEFCLKLVLAHPNEVGFQELGLSDPAEFSRFQEKFLKPWILLGRLEITEKGIRAKEPHLLIPHSPDWAEIRSANFKRAYDNLQGKISADTIRRRLAFREIATRSLRPEQVEAWIAALKELDARFRGLPGAEEPTGGDNLPHSLLIAFGPRDLALPEDVLRRCKQD